MSSRRTGGHEYLVVSVDLDAKTFRIGLIEGLTDSTGIIHLKSSVLDEFNGIVLIV